MAASGYTPISLYYSSTAAATPVAGNLVNGELAINITDGKLFYKDNGGTVKVIAGTGGTGVVAGSNTQVQFNNNGVFGASSAFTWDGTTLSATKFAGALNGTVGATTPNTGAFTTLSATGAITVNTTTNNQSYTTTGAGVITISSGTTGTLDNFNIGGTTAGTGKFSSVTDTGLTSGRVTYASTGGLLADSANLTFDGTYLVANSIKDSALTSDRVTYAGASGLLQDSANLTFDGTTLTAANITSSGTITFSGGTANGVAYLNGSKVLTTGSALTFDGTNLGLNTASLGTFNRGLYINSGAGAYAGIQLNNTAYPNGVYFSITNADLNIFNANSTGDTIFGVNNAEQMRLTSTGLGIGTSSPSRKLDVATTGADNFIKVNTTGAYNSGIEFANSGVVYGQIYFNNVSPYNLSILQQYSTGSLVFGTNNTEKMRLDSSGNLGLGVTPSAWGSQFKALQIGGSYSSFGQRVTSTADLFLGWNVYNDSTGTSGASGFKYTNTGDAAALYEMTGAAGHRWFTAPSGTAGNTISFTQAMTLDASGNLALGTTTNKVTELSGAGNGLTIGGATAPCIGIWDTSDASYLLTLGQVDTGSYVLNKANGPLILGTNNVERMRIDSSGNLGLGVTPSAWGSGYKAINFPYTSISTTGAGSIPLYLSQNCYHNGTNWVSIVTGPSKRYELSDFGSVWYNGASSTAGNAISFTQAMTLDASGRLGIGTTTPNDKLEINGGNIIFSGSNWVYSYSGGTYNQVRSGIYYDGSTPSLQFYTSQAECMRIDSSGNVSIGTTASGGYRLRVTGTTGIYCDTVNNNAIYGYASGNGVGVYGQSSSNYGVYGVSTSSDGVRGYSASGNGVYGQSAGSNIGVYGLSATGIGVYAQSNGANYGCYGVSAGNYGVYGKANAYGYAGLLAYSPTSSYYWLGAYEPNSSTGWAAYGVGNTYTSGTYQNSDIRLKENVETLSGSLAKILALRPVEFDWKENSDSYNAGHRRDAGLIAQEAIEVMPEIVLETEAPAPMVDPETGEARPASLNQELGKFYSVEYGKLIPHLLKAIQELKAELDATKAEVAALKGA